MKRVLIALLLPTVFLTTYVVVVQTNAQSQEQLTQLNQELEVVLQSDADEITCPTGYQRLVEVEMLNFYQTADEVLLTANLSSESLNYLFRNYRRAQNNLRSIEEIVNNFFDERINSEQVNEQIIRRCLSITNQAKQDLRYVFLNVYAQVTQRKKDFLLFEKYDAINSKFELLQEDLSDINQGLKKFDDLFPCFVTSCISR